VAGTLGNEYWARFRLTRGEDLGAYGVAQFGEIEDYLLLIVPEPASALALALGAAICGCRWSRRVIR
jgi:hypothetical protein